MSESKSKKPRLDLDSEDESGTPAEISESNVMELPRGDEKAEAPSEPSSSASTPQSSDLPRRVTNSIVWALFHQTFFFT